MSHLDPSSELNAASHSVNHPHLNNAVTPPNLSKLYSYSLGIVAYFIWGVSPIYFKSINDLAPPEIIIHRIIWSAICCALFLFIFKKQQIWKQLKMKPKYLFILLCTGLMLSANWLVYVWAVNNDNMLETSLGYYINPLISVLLAMLVLKERLRLLQWSAIIFAFIGVLIQIILIGKLPWISLFLALSFSLYGLIRKMVPINVIPGMMIETWTLVPVAIGWLFFHDSAVTLTTTFWHSHLLLLAMLAGPLTLGPLMLFNVAAKNLPYSAIGFLQYISPTMTLLLAIFYFNEPVSFYRLITFFFIWAGLVLFSLDTYFVRHGGKIVMH